MTTTEIAAEHGVSRQSIHAYRRTGAFPQPVEGEGSTRPRFRADEVAAYFAANPPQPGKKRGSPPKQQGASVTTTTARDQIVEALESPGLVGLRSEEAAELVDAYRASELKDFLWRLEQSAGDAAAEKFLEDNPELAELLRAAETGVSDG